MIRILAEQNEARLNMPIGIFVEVWNRGVEVEDDRERCARGERCRSGVKKEVSKGIKREKTRQA